MVVDNPGNTFSTTSQLCKFASYNLQQQQPLTTNIMSAATLYRQYKSLSSGIFEPVEEKPNKSATFYLNTARRYRRCAQKRSEFQQRYVSPEARDSSHKRAIDSAYERSREAEQIFIQKNMEHLKKKYLDKPTITIDNNNTFLPLEPNSPFIEPEVETVTPRATEPLFPPLKKNISEESNELDDDTLIAIQRIQSLLEKFEMIEFLLDIVNAFWSKTSYGDKNKNVLIIHSWIRCAEEPLNAKAYLNALKANKEALLWVCDQPESTEFALGMFSEVLNDSTAVLDSEGEIDEEHERLAIVATFMRIRDFRRRVVPETSKELRKPKYFREYQKYKNSL